MVLESYNPKYKDISRIIEGKAREFNTSNNDMLSEEQVLNSIFTEVFDSDLISPDQRVEIEARLDALFSTLEGKPSIPTIQEFKLLKEESKKKRDSLTILTVAVSMVGASTSVLYSFLKDPSALLASNTEWLYSGLGVFVVSLAMITLMSIVRKEKEEISSPSRSSSAMSSAVFEIEVAKAIDKSGYKYQVDPRIGDHRPDFVIDANDKRIAIDAKAWGDIVPLSGIRRTIQRLESLSREDGIDGVYLVTKKPAPSKGFNSEDSIVKVVSMSEFTTLLKNKQVA
jgi:hypothetical protein